MKIMLVLIISIFNLGLFAQNSTTNDSLLVITRNSLLRKLKEQNAVRGFAIVVETSTGKVVSNVGFKTKGTKYISDTTLQNSTVNAGGLYLPISLAVLLDNTSISINDTVDLNEGHAKIGGADIYDSEHHALRSSTLKDVIAVSSNVGIAKAVFSKYGNNEKQFYNELSSLLSIASMPTDKKDLPFVSIGYKTNITPLRLLAFYNGLANSGNYIEIGLDGSVPKNKMFLKNTTRNEIQKCLEAVCIEGTCKNSFLGYKPHTIAGKTATTLNIVDGKFTNLYTSSFVGYFPANNPMYTCLVMIENKPNSPKYYGAQVAAPVFREITKYLLKQ